MIKPRGRGDTGAPSTPRPTIRIGPRAPAASRGETPGDADDLDVEDDGTEPAEDGEGESSLTSNNDASTSRVVTPQENGKQEEEDSQMVDVDGEEEGSQAVDDADGEAVGTPKDDEDDEEEEVVPVVRGRGRGRPRGSRARVGGGTPRPRGRPRGRGRGRGRPSTKARQDEDGEVLGDEDEDGTIGGGKPFRRINGEIYFIEGDEYVTPDNPKGDEKIDKNGRLLGGARLSMFSQPDMLSVVQVDSSSHKHSRSQIDIPNANTCLLLMLRVALASVIRCTTSVETPLL